MMQSSEDKNKSISVNIAILTVSDTRTINNDNIVHLKQGRYCASVENYCCGLS